MQFIKVFIGSFLYFSTRPVNYFQFHTCDYLSQFTERMLQKTTIFLPKKKIISIVIIVTLICICPFNHKAEEEYHHCAVAWLVDARLQKIVLSYLDPIPFLKDFKINCCSQIFMNSKRPKISVHCFLNHGSSALHMTSKIHHRCFLHFRMVHFGGTAFGQWHQRFFPNLSDPMNLCE